MASPSSRRVLLLEIILAHCWGVTDGCKVSVTQEELLEFVPGATVNLSCHYTTSGCSGKLKTLWFRYLTTKHEICNTSGSKFKVFTSNQQTNLEIRNLQVNDSAIYICGIADTTSNSSMSKTTGLGTTVVVRDKQRSIVTPECVALLVICILLFLYCIALSLIYKFQPKLNLFKNIKKRENKTQNKSKNYRSQSIFQTIAQEYNKRYPRKSRHHQSTVAEDDNIYQNTT